MANRWGNNGHSDRLYFLASKITSDGDCSHKIKRLLLLGRKVMTNLDSILKIRHVVLPTKVHLVKAMVFPSVIYGCESWTIKKAEHWIIDAFELWCWRRLLRVPWTARRSNQSILKEISPKYSLDWCWSSSTLTTWYEEGTHWKSPWCWERLKAGGERDDGISFPSTPPSCLNHLPTVSSSDTIILGIKLQHLDLRGHSQSSPNLSERNIKDYVEFIHTTSVHSVHQLLYKYSGRYCGFSSIPAVMEEFLEEICIIFFLKKSLFIYLSVLGLNCRTLYLVSWPGIEPRPPVESWSLSHWATREVTSSYFCKTSNLEQNNKKNISFNIFIRISVCLYSQYIHIYKYC